MMQGDLWMRANGDRECARIRTAGEVLLVVILINGIVWAEDARRPIDVQYGIPQQLATLANEEINESSGLAASRIERGLFWTHNDSGDKPRIFAFDAAGRDRGEVRIAKAEAKDWEDMVSVSLDGKPYLILADVGDNVRRREFCSLYAVREPAKPKKSDARSVNVIRIRFRYRDGPRDCEAIAIDPVSKHVFLTTKAFSTRCPIYQLGWPERPSDAILVAERIGSVPLPLVTAMDIAADGQRAVMLTYGDAYEFRRRDGESWSKAFSRPPQLVTMPQRRQGEAICYGQDSRTLYLTSERTPTPFWRVAPRATQ